MVPKPDSQTLSVDRHTQLADPSSPSPYPVMCTLLLYLYPHSRCLSAYPTLLSGHLVHLVGSRHPACRTKAYSVQVRFDLGHRHVGDLNDFLGILNGLYTWLNTDE